MAQWTRLAAGVGLLLLAAELHAQPAETSLVRGESPQTRKRLAEAEQKLLDGQAAEATEDLQRILDEAADDLVSVDGRQHRSARSVAHQILTRLPATALKSYQNRIDEPARTLLEAAKRTRDPRPLWQLLDRYFVSRSSEEALLLLGDWLYERGDFRRAEQQWRRLLPDTEDELRYPNPKSDAAAIRARIVLAIRSQGEAARAQAELAKIPADAKGTLAGKSGAYVETLREWLAKPLPAPAAAARDWPSYGNTPDRNSSLNSAVPVRWPTRPFWSANIPGVEALGIPVRSALGRPPFGYPVIHDGSVYLTDGSRVIGYDLATSEFNTVYPPGAAAVARLPNDPPSCPTLTVAHGRIYARLGTPVVRIAEANKNTSTIVCLDPTAKPALRLVWRLKPPAVEGRAPGIWEGAPLVANGRLWAAFSRIEGGRIVFAVACYDPADADEEPDRPVWVAEVCDCPLPTGPDQARGRLELLTLSGRHVVFNTNAGVVAALDATTGNRAWAFQYPRAMKRVYEANRSWEANPAVASGGRVFVAPADSERVYALDAETGRELWVSGSVEGAQILGVAGHRVIVSTSGLVRGLRGLNVTTGSYRRPEGWLQTTGLGYGQGLVAQDVILWPSRDGLYFLNPESGDPIRNAPPLGTMNPDRNLFGNLACVDGWLVVVGATDVRAYRPIGPPFVQPEELRHRFTWLMDQKRYREAAAAEFPNRLRAQAAAHLQEEIPELRGEWILGPSGELITYGTLLDRRSGRAEPDRSVPRAPWSPADRAVLDSPHLTAESRIARTVRLPTGTVPLLPIPGAKPPRTVFVSCPSELLSISLESATQRSHPRVESFTHAAELPDGFVTAGPFAVAVYGARREPIWIFRVPDFESVTTPELSSFNLAGEWLYARLGERHLLAFDLRAQVVAWVLGTHGDNRFEPVSFHTLPAFTPQIGVTDRLLAVQLTDGRRWLVQTTTGRVKDDSPTARVPWAAPPIEVAGLLAVADGPGCLEFITLTGKPRHAFRVHGETSFTGEPIQVRRFDEDLFAIVRRNSGLELFRIDPATGKPEWREPAFLESGAIDIASVDADPQRILIPTLGSLSAFDRDDGSLAWRVKLPGTGRWTVRAGRTVAIAVPREAFPEEPFEEAWGRLLDSFLRNPRPWRLPWLVAALYDCWTERAVPVLLFDLETGKLLKALTLPCRGPTVLPVFDGTTAVVAAGDRLVWLK